jgi:hypothetical protein
MRMKTEVVNIYTYKITQQKEFGELKTFTVETPIIMPQGVGSFQVSSVVNGDVRITAVYGNVISVELIPGASPETK